MTDHNATRPQSGLSIFDVDHDLEQAKAFVRLRQAAVPVPESFFALRTGALMLQIVGGAIIGLALFSGVLFALTDFIDRELGLPGIYVAVFVAVVGGMFGLLMLVIGELLTLQVVIARNTRLTTVILSEMNYASAAARVDGMGPAAPRH